MDCIFCKIINNELPSTRVYEDEFQIAFLDLFPVAAGHTLLVPKKHYINAFDADPETAQAVYPALITLANAVKKATGCEGVNLVQNNGEAAGQVVFHSHIHIIPRYSGDDIRMAIAGKTQATPEQLAEMAEKIKLNL